VLFRRAFPPDTDGGGKWASIYLTKQYYMLTPNPNPSPSPSPSTNPKPSLYSPSP